MTNLIKLIKTIHKNGKKCAELEKEFVLVEGLDKFNDALNKSEKTYKENAPNNYFMKLIFNFGYFSNL